ncbi:hypothetical protein FX983_01094 [Pseudomonas frederiksbergensis]|uniref:Uncharacterized protein n=1 Tax=Pseudomonas frederiksbergensis TaxID=104087 RepID=A0A6L5BXN0_9PSED|nr:hypothetical protein FX983_01094 [Pseudomonas frederiksbergensis]
MVALQPWGGKHANLLHCLRSQRAHQFSGGNYSGLCEAVLPVLGRPLRTYMGVRTDFQALIAATGATPRHTPTGANQKLAGGAAARTVPAGWILATRLTTGSGSQPPRHIQASPFPCPPWASLIIDLESRFRMPAPQAYKPPTQSHLILTISARRNPRSGRLPDKTAPKILGSADRSSPRPQPVKFAAHLGAPNYSFVLTGSPARSAGDPAWVQGTALPQGGRAARDPHKKLSAAN